MIRTHRQRRALLVTGAAAAGVTALGVPAALWLRSRRDGTDDAANLPTPPPEPPPGAGNLRVPMRLRPTWLPEGFVELSRMAQVNGVLQTRYWATPEAIAAAQAGDYQAMAAAGWVTLSISAVEAPPVVTSPWPSESPPVSPQPPPSPNAAVGGRPAWLAAPAPDTPAHLTWYPEPGIQATLDTLAPPDAGAIALRVAAGLVPDSIGGCEVSLNYGWLPAVAGDLWDLEVTGWDGGWRQRLDPRPRQNIGFTPVLARLASHKSMLTGIETSGEPVELLGRPGVVRGGPDVADAVVEITGGRWLWVTCRLDEIDTAKHRDTVIRIVNEMHVGPDPYLGWIGRR